MLYAIISSSHNCALEAVQTHSVSDHLDAVKHVSHTNHQLLTYMNYATLHAFHTSTFDRGVDIVRKSACIEDRGLSQNYYASAANQRVLFGMASGYKLTWIACRFDISHNGIAMRAHT